MAKSLSSRILSPAERARGLEVAMYVDTNGKRVFFKAHKSYLNCECGSIPFEQDLTIESHLVDAEVGDPTMHRDDCRAYLLSRRRHGQKIIELMQKRRAEEKAQREKARIAKVRVMMKEVATLGSKMSRSRSNLLSIHSEIAPATSCYFIKSDYPRD